MLYPYNMIAGGIILMELEAQKARIDHELVLAELDNEIIITIAEMEAGAIALVTPVSLTLAERKKLREEEDWERGCL